MSLNRRWPFSRIQTGPSAGPVGPPNPVPSCSGSRSSGAIRRMLSWRTSTVIGFLHPSAPSRPQHLGSERCAFGKGLELGPLHFLVDAHHVPPLRKAAIRPRDDAFTPDDAGIILDPPGNELRM